jgi:uncharacterized delta-60 repeat protein
MALSKLTASGVLDTSFSGNGKKAIRFGSPNNFAASAQGDEVAVRSDGAIYVAGAVGVTEVGVARLLPTGERDPSFGLHGRMVFTPENAQGYVGGLAVDADGGVTLSFQDTVQTSAGPAAAIGVARIGPDGTLDASFGPDGDGLVAITASREATTGGLIVRSDGSVIVTGQLKGRMCIVALKPNGALSNAFGGDGIYRHHGTSTSYGTDVALAPSGKILASGTSRRGGLFVIRLDPDLTFDATFGSGGIQIVDPTMKGWGLASAAHGKVWVSGFTEVQGVARARLFRLAAGGRPDDTFSDDGSRWVPQPPRSWISLGGLAAMTNDTVVWAGTYYTNTRVDMAAVRFLGS